MLLLVSLLLSADPEEIFVETDADGVVARSPADQGNFLFRLPAGYRRVDPPQGWRVAFETGSEAPSGRVRLRFGPLEASELGRGLGELAAARTVTYRKEIESAAEARFEGSGARRRAVFEGKVGGAGVSRIVLFVRDGDRLYELLLDESPPGSERGPELSTIADGFTILSPKPIAQDAAATGDVKPKTLSQDFYRITLLKPEGFAEESFDPNSEPGLIYRFRRRDAQNNLCTIDVRAHLARTAKEAVADTAQAALDDFFRKHPEAKGPKRAPRTSVAGAKDALRFQVTGKQGTSMIVFQEDRLFLEHGNGWVYEVRVATFAGAQKEFRKQIAAFWQSLKFASK